MPWLLSFSQLNLDNQWNKPLKIQKKQFYWSEKRTEKQINSCQAIPLLAKKRISMTKQKPKTKGKNKTENVQSKVHSHAAVLRQSLKIYDTMWQNFFLFCQTLSEREWPPACTRGRNRSTHGREVNLRFVRSTLDSNARAGTLLIRMRARTHRPTRQK